MKYWEIIARNLGAGVGVCYLVSLGSETEDKFEDAMEVAASSPLFEIARVLVRFDHVVSLVKRESQQHHSFRFVSLNGITRSTLPVESRMPDSSYFI